MSGFNPFGSIPVPKKGRTNFDESHGVSGSFPLSKVIPVFMTETIPGDRWKINAFNLTKLETLIAPAMQQVNASLLWFKIPKRLLFNKFKDWYSGGVDGQDNSQKPHIYLRHFLWELTDFLSDDEMNYFIRKYLSAGSLWQYMGLPAPITYSGTVWTEYTIDQILTKNEGVYVEPEKVDSDFIDIMPFMAYAMLYDQYFRDQTLCDPVFVDSESGDLTLFAAKNTIEFVDEDEEDVSIELDAPSPVNLADGGEIDCLNFVWLLKTFNRAWQKEYFTSALPTTQRGPEVKIPIVNDTAPVTLDDDQDVYLDDITVQNSEVAALEGSVEAVTNAPYSAELKAGGEEGDAIKRLSGTLSNNIKGIADLTGLSPITIIAFRNLFKLQAFLEKNNISGGRFIETILAQWGERVPDFTVQRAQYVRATSMPVQISEVLATANSASGVNNQVGDQAGHARTQGNLGSVGIYTHEPSFIFGLYCVTCPPAYAGQGIPRLFQRITRFDEPWRDFQHIGEQAIKVRELYYPYYRTAVDKSDLDFGYQQRYSEYKYMPNRVVGDFVTSLSYWHMARMFDTVPTLNADFVTQHLDERIFAVQNSRPVLADFWFNATAKRKLSKFSTPKLT